MAEARFVGGDLILKVLAEHDVDVIFGYPGGVTLPLYDRLYLQNRLRHILVGHEQGAMHAAEGYARSTGKPGVVLVTSGPGATNTVTGLVDAMMDSIPLVVLTGQVVSNLIGNDAFQEADTTGITRAATKHNYLVRSTEDLARTLHEAFYVATHGRPGPVLVDIPKDVILGTGAYVEAEHGVPRNYAPRTEPDMAKIEQAVELLASAKKPIIYAGGGVINAGPHASKLLAQLVHLTGFPCTTTLMALGAFPASDPLFLGMPGMHGTYEANLTMHHCDVMFNVGARFDDRVTGKLANFAPHARKVHIDIDPSSINKNVQVEVPIIADAGEALAAVIKVWKRKKKTIDAKALKAWWKQIDEWRARDCLRYQNSGTVIKPQYAIQRLYELTKGRGDVFVTTEVGQHQMWAAQFFKFEKPNHWLTSGGLGTMGYGLPAAMGVQIAHPKALVVDIAGEASILMNIQEMSTLAQYRLPVKVFLINNQYMGMVRQWQELIHGGRYSESYMDSLPDFVKLAESFGAVGLRATKPSEVDGVIKAMIECPKAVIADIMVDPKENCFPMIPSGAAHNEMLLGPQDKREEAISEDGMVLV